MATIIAVDQPKIMIPPAAWIEASNLHCSFNSMSPYPNVVNVTIENYNASDNCENAPLSI